MIFDQLIINNYGVYKGKQIFDLSTNKKKPIVLIGALNGSGKTTFLNAVDFVLYGKFSSIFQSQSSSYENFLKKNVNNENYNEGASIELKFHRRFKGKKQNFKILRALKQNGSTKIKEQFEAYVDDQYDEDITKDWENFVEQILPAKVASLFFFDGEKIEQLADLDNSKKVLHKAINSLLGFEIVDRLGLDLNEFQKRSSLQLKSGEEQKQIIEISKEIEGLDKSINNFQEKIAKNEEAIIEVNNEISQLDAELSQKGATYYNKRKEYENDLKIKEEKIVELENKLIQLSLEESPFLLIKKELNEVLEQSKSADNIQEKIKEQEITNDLIGSVEEFTKKNCKDENFSEELINFLNKKKVKLLKSTSLTDQSNNVKTEKIDYLINTQLDTIQTTLEKLIKQYHSAKENYEKIKLMVNKIPTDDQIKPLVDKQSELKKNKTALQTKINVLQDEISPLNSTKNQKGIALRQLYSTKMNQELENMDKQRFVEYSEKIKNVISSFHVKALDHHIKKLEKLILDCFKKLHSKKNFVSKIKIDTNTYELKTFDRKNKEIDTNKLSAGERQLLAVAILWGLAKASTNAAPTIIDTPLGRLDSKHRKNLVEQYCKPQAGEQIILLSTDEEFNQKYLKKINPYLSRSYLIAYDQNNNGSKVQEGYFF